LPEQFFTDSNAIAVVVPDNTLSPILHKNDIIYVEESKPPTDKDLYLVRVKGHGHLIRHVLLSGDLCTLAAPGAPSLTVTVSKLLESRKVIAATIFGAHLKHK
jgi:hypothetical protein